MKLLRQNQLIIVRSHARFAIQARTPKTDAVRRQKTAKFARKGQTRLLMLAFAPVTAKRIMPESIVMDLAIFASKKDWTALRNSRLFNTGTCGTGTYLLPI